MWTPPCDGPCDTVRRPYARSGLSSVTTLCDQIAKHQLEWGASKEAALFAVHHQRDWRDLDPQDAVERIRTHFRGVWDSSADVGTLVHSVNEAWLAGREWNAADVDLSTLHVKSEQSLAALIDRMPPYVAGLAAFWDECQPDSIATEIVVRNKDAGYVGTADWIARINGESYLLDIKTTSQMDPDKGVYLDSWRPQLAMYQRATEVVHYHGKTEVAAWPLEDCFERPAKAAILHLRGDDGYQLIECDTQAPIMDELIASLKVMHRWSLKGGHATPPPVIVSECKPAEPELIVYEPRPDAPVSVAAMLD